MTVVGIMVLTIFLYVVLIVALIIWALLEVFGLSFIWVIIVAVVLIGLFVETRI